MTEPYKKALLEAEAALVRAVRARPDTFAPILVSILAHVRDLLRLEP